ncbi:hypothetical protein ASG90_07335 [Nocardioides sp. Soil797]|nr:hypothetical protein ASG90_07335 [Nocardioides sp. Soil797]
MRHAKAIGFAASDRERDLEPSGRRDAAAAGKWMATKEIRPDHVLHSSALRTTSTWQEASRALGEDIRVESSSALYAAEPEAALDLIRSTPDDVRRLLVIGHNPTIGMLAQLLDDGEGDDEAAAGMITGFPTCALAVFDITVDWADIAPGDLRLRDFHVSRAE